MPDLDLVEVRVLDIYIEGESILAERIRMAETVPDDLASSHTLRLTRILCTARNRPLKGAS